MAGCCRYVEERMGWVIAHLWHLIGQDVESTTYNVARKFVNAPDQEPDVLRRRAEALYSISHMFGVRSTCWSPQAAYCQGSCALAAWPVSKSCPLCQLLPMLCCRALPVHRQ